MWSFLGSVAAFVVLLFQEFFSAQSRAREANQEFQVGQKEFHDLVAAAVARQQAQAAKDSAGAGDAWDQADQDRQG